MKMPVILGILRHILTLVGGALASNGYASADDANMIVGGIVAAVGVIGSVVEKNKKKPGI